MRVWDAESGAELAPILREFRPDLIVIDMQRDFIEPGGFGEVLGRFFQVVGLFAPMVGYHLQDLVPGVEGRSPHGVARGPGDAAGDRLPLVGAVLGVHRVCRDADPLVGHAERLRHLQRDRVVAIVGQVLAAPGVEATGDPGHVPVAVAQKGRAEVPHPGIVDGQLQQLDIAAQQIAGRCEFQTLRLPVLPDVVEARLLEIAAGIPAHIV